MIFGLSRSTEISCKIVIFFASSLSRGGGRPTGLLDHRASTGAVTAVTVPLSGFAWLKAFNIIFAR